MVMADSKSEWAGNAPDAVSMYNHLIVYNYGMDYQFRITEWNCMPR